MFLAAVKASLDCISEKYFNFVARNERGGLTYSNGGMILEALTVESVCPFTRHFGTRTALFIFIDIPWFYFRPDCMEAGGFFHIINACRILVL